MLSGKQIELRPLVLSDVNILNKWKNNEEIYKFLGGGFVPTSIDEQREWMPSMIKMNQNKRFMIETKNCVPIGMIGLYDISNVNKTAEIGMFIGELNYQGKGFGSESYHLLENYAKNTINIRKLKLNVVGSNLAGVKFWKKNHFLEVGKYERERYIDGRYEDLIIMEKFL